MSTATLEYDLAAERVRSGQFETELADANEQLIELESQLAASRDQVAELEAERDRLTEMADKFATDYRLYEVQAIRDLAESRARVAALEEIIRSMGQEVSQRNQRIAAIEAERDDLQTWKRGQLTVKQQWDEVDELTRSHPDIVMGESVAKAAMRFIRRDIEHQKRVT